MSVVLKSTGAILVKPWEEPFYAHVDSFLVEARSVSNVIESSFGHDKALMPVVQDWFKSLSPDEQTRRREFSKQFKSDRDLFRDHHLTKARDAKEHRRGFALVEGVVVGPSGKPYPASPTTPVPTAESPPIGEDAPPWARTQPAIAVWPSGDLFRIGGKSLFPELQAYLQLARVHPGPHPKATIVASEAASEKAGKGIAWAGTAARPNSASADAIKIFRMGSPLATDRHVYYETLNASRRRTRKGCRSSPSSTPPAPEREPAPHADPIEELMRIVGEHEPEQPPHPKPAEPEPKRRQAFEQQPPSPVQAILDDPPIHIRPKCSHQRGCEG